MTAMTKPSDNTAETPESVDPVPPNGSPPPQRVRASVKPLANPWLLLIVLLATVSGWQWYSARQQLALQQQGWDKRLGETEALLQATQNALREVRQQAEKNGSRLGDLEARMDQGGGGRLDVATNRDLAALAEMEHALVLAMQQFQSGGEVMALLATLQRIEGRVNGLEHPAVAERVRKSLGRDLERLRKVPVVDFQGLAQRLVLMVGDVDRWSFAMESRPSAVAAPVEETGMPVAAFFNSLWAEIRALIRIERIEGSVPAALSVDQQFFVRENLKLRLLSARLALLARDHAGFHRELVVVQDLMARYIHRADPSVQQAEQALLPMLGISWPGELPQPAESLAAIRQAQLQIEKKAAP